MKTAEVCERVCVCVCGLCVCVCVWCVCVLWVCVCTSMCVGVQRGMCVAACVLFVCVWCACAVWVCVCVWRVWSVRWAWSARRVCVLGVCVCVCDLVVCVCVLVCACACVRVEVWSSGQVHQKVQEGWLREIGRANVRVNYGVRLRGTGLFNESDERAADIVGEYEECNSHTLRVNKTGTYTERKRQRELNEWTPGRSHLSSPLDLTNAHFSL